MIEQEQNKEIMNDIVNHPSHYTDGKIEVIDFIEEKCLNFHRGNAVKYIARAGKKDPTKEIDGKPYSKIVEEARKYIKSVGGFEKFAEWGLF